MFARGRNATLDQDEPSAVKTHSLLQTLIVAAVKGGRVLSLDPPPHMGQRRVDIFSSRDGCDGPALQE
jgi:hypothetical protein